MTQTEWSTTNKAADVVVTGDGYDAYSTSAAETGGVVVSATGKTSGKFYAELSNVQAGSTRALAAGLYRETTGLSTPLGYSGSGGWGAWITLQGGNTRRTYSNGAFAHSQSLSFAVNQRCRIAIDIDAGKIWLAHFGAGGWLGGGDPEAGTNPTYSFTPDGAVYYLAACPLSGNSSGTGNKIRLIDPVSWAFAAPAGFDVWTA